MPEPPPADRVPARTDADARKRYFRFLQASLSAVHPWAQWWAAPVPGRDALWNALTNPDWLEFRTSEGGVSLRATQRYRICADERYPGERKVVTGDYGYTLRDAGGNEILSWQWHPSVGNLDTPHVHVGRGPSGGFHKKHIPTGRVAFEDVLLFLIRDYGLQPIEGDVGRATIDESLRRFRRFRTWS